MSLLTEIEKAHARKQALLEEIAAIDVELERARYAISGKPYEPRVTRDPNTPW